MSPKDNYTGLPTGCRFALFVSHLSKSCEAKNQNGRYFDGYFDGSRAKHNTKAVLPVMSQPLLLGFCNSKLADLNAICITNVL
jgi:hypothetical protein